MFSFKFNQILIFLSIIPNLIYTELVSEEEILNKRSVDPTLVSDVLSEEMFDFDKPNTPTIDPESETIGSKWKWKCAMDEDQLKSKVTEILKMFVPNLLKLRPIQRGDGIKIVLNKGKLTINKDFKILGQPICQEVDENKIKYEIMTCFEDLIGIYDWKIYNLFGKDFFESAILKIKKIEVQFKIIENISGRFELNDIKVGKIDGFKVDVNIPEQITNVRYLKRMIQFIVSRISTLVANRSLFAIKANLQDSLGDSIRNKIKLNFNVVKEKLVFN